MRAPPPTRSPTQAASGAAAPVLHDAARPLAPIPVAEQALVQLAGGKPRQFLFEVDRARAFDMGKVLAAESDQLLGEIRGWADAGHRLHDSLHLFAEVRVG